MLVSKAFHNNVGLYIIDEMVLTNVVKLQLLTSMRIYSMVNIS